MDPGDAAQDRYLLAICSQCHEPLYPRREDAGGVVSCPACGAKVTVPHEEPLPEPTGDEYAVGDADYRARRVTYIKLACPTCRTLLYAEPSRVGSEMTCPDCGVKVLVRPQRPSAARQRTAEEIGDYRVGGAEQPGEQQEPDHLLVVCPTCQARLHPSRRHIGKRVKCPDCGRPVVVTAPQERAIKSPEQPSGTYGLETPQTQRRTIDDYIGFACPQCGTRLTAAKQHAGKRMRCPDCRRAVTIPQAQQLRKERTPEMAEDRAAAEDFTAAPALRAPVEPQAIEHRIPPAQRPEWLYFSGVFSFPWHGEALSRWGLMSLGMAISGEVATAGLLISGVAGGGMNLIAGFSLAFFAMVVFWTSLWTYSYSAGCMLAVMQDTSSGSQEVLSWPEGDWREWIWPMLHVGYVLTVAATAGYAIGWVASLVAPSGSIIGAAASFVLFPIFLVSSLEANSALVILTRPVLASLVSQWWGWLTVLALAAAMVCGWITLVWIVSQVSWFIVPLAAGPALAAMLLIYARLLGRLAWSVTI
jgi:DNA-directed RNA polymerase subunit M/transcription elongation factor TFIIS